MNSRQLKLEEQSHREAVKKRRRDLQQAKEKSYISGTTEGRQLFLNLFLPYSEALNDRLQIVMQGKASKWGHFAIHTHDLTEELGVEYVAYCAMKKMIDCIDTGNNQLVEVATTIGRILESEARINYYIELGGKDTERLVDAKQKKKNSSPRHKHLGIKLSVEKQLLDKGWAQDDLFPTWASEVRTGIGLFLIEAAVQAGWFTRTPKRMARNKTENVLLPSPAVAQWLEHARSNIDSWSYLSWPLVEPPLDWKLQDQPSRKNISGGYHSPLLRQVHPLCGGRKGMHSDSQFGQVAIDLLNTLQRTAWCIDQEVLKVVEACWVKDISVGSFRAVTNDPRRAQVMPEHIKNLPKEDAERVAWRKLQHSIHEAHHEQVERARSTMSVLSMARQFSKEPHFYLSWECDFRGRLYDQQAWLGRQKSDLEKSLSRFAEGCLLNERSEELAAQAVGAAFLGSRGTFNERSRWTRSHSQLLEAIADNPIGTATQWEQADDPWQFLQLAIEWVKVVLRKQQTLWHVPVTADATASGLQLLSAMRRDPKGMEFSNLTPQKEPDAPPKDAYLEVLRVARELAEADRETAWLSEHLIHRSLGKPVLMVAIYGGSYRTNRQDIIMALTKEGLYPNPVAYKDTKVLTDLLRKASKKVFPAAFETLAWIEKLAEMALEQGATSHTWSTPTADSIQHVEYQPADAIRVETHFLGKVSIGLGNLKLPNISKLKTSLSPQFVHSYDAAVLKAAFHNWQRPLSTIHDCIAVLPADMEDAHERLRKSFVEVCDGDPLGRLADDFGIDKMSLERPESLGQDLETIIESNYMFN
ncbi:DNA-directed RNA polymerase [Synechococcus sp. CC9616]|uniref:DNA-directed RNA polymerase n=1 Tax=Synechococcus sp. CC9616 TaxID=110663 RepID=UPI0004AD41A9|nr:DNA-directed RNA polymerase [Synechococcus sp. CC9616]